MTEHFKVSFLPLTVVYFTGDCTELVKCGSEKINHRSDFCDMQEDSVFGILNNCDVSGTVLLPNCLRFIAKYWYFPQWLVRVSKNDCILGLNCTSHIPKWFAYRKWSYWLASISRQLLGTFHQWDMNNISLTQLFNLKRP